MKIIFLDRAGRSREISLTRRWLALAGALFSLMVLAPLSVAVSWYAFGSIDDRHLEEWRDVLSGQQAELQSLESMAAAQSESVGRQLAVMQARLLRMEALGARVATIADLDDGEFAFDEAPATGGPENAVRPLAGFELQDALASLSQDLKRREAELGVLESLLRDREYEASTTIAGRPVARGWVSSPFGRRVDPFSGGTAWHSGLDFTARTGTDVLAAAGGVVVYAAYRPDYGNTIEINHGDGYVTRYAHQKELKVVTGDVVKPGQVIGSVGATGRASGPHLHFEVMKNGRQVDPQRYIAGTR